MNNDKIHLTVISDDGFMIPSIVMLTSAKLNKNKQSRYCVHFICNKVSQYFRKKLCELHSDDFEIVLYDAPKKDFSSVDINIHVTESTFYKLEVPDILKDINKVIHIDGDVLVHGDLSEFFHTDLAGNTLGVVGDIITTKLGDVEKLGIPKAFNAGIMLMDLEKMRNDGDVAKLENMLMNIPDNWTWLEQDCLNVYYEGKALFLPPKYNCAYMNIKGLDTPIEEVNEYYGTSYESYYEMLDDSVILHMCGTPGKRPWQVTNGVHSAAWQHYYDLSPVKHIYLERPDVSLASTPGKINSLECELEQVKLLLIYPILKKRYRQAKIKSMFTLGKTRFKYKQKKQLLKIQVRRCRALLKEYIFNALHK